MPAEVSRLAFCPVQTEWLEQALAEVLATSLDPADRLAVAENGTLGAAKLLLSLANAHFVQEPQWWQRAETEQGEAAGFVLCSVFPQEEGQARQGTIFYMGVLPAHRGNRYGRQLLGQATRILVEAGVSRILCDTAACNAPMISAFRAAGYMERAPWERPLR
jgi:ribosomal protein S18 acetylase RimI-like enzyme